MTDSFWHLIWHGNIIIVVWRILYSWFPVILAQWHSFQSHPWVNFGHFEWKAVKIFAFKLLPHCICSVQSSSSIWRRRPAKLECVFHVHLGHFVSLSVRNQMHKHAKIKNICNSLFSCRLSVLCNHPNKVSVYSLTTLAGTEIFVFAPVWPWVHSPLFVLQVRFRGVLLFVWLYSDPTACLRCNTGTSLHKIPQMLNQKMDLVTQRIPDILLHNFFESESLFKATQSDAFSTLSDKSSLSRSHNVEFI